MWYHETNSPVKFNKSSEMIMDKIQQTLSAWKVGVQSVKRLVVLVTIKEPLDLVRIKKLFMLHVLLFSAVLRKHVRKTLHTSQHSCYNFA